MSDIITSKKPYFSMRYYVEVNKEAEEKREYKGLNSLFLEPEPRKFEVSQHKE